MPQPWVEEEGRGIPGAVSLQSAAQPSRCVLRERREPTSLLKVRVSGAQTLPGKEDVLWGSAARPSLASFQSSGCLGS